MVCINLFSAANLCQIIAHVKKKIKNSSDYYSVTESVSCSNLNRTFTGLCQRLLHRDTSQHYGTLGLVPALTGHIKLSLCLSPEASGNLNRKCFFNDRRCPCALRRRNRPINRQ